MFWIFGFLYTFPLLFPINFLLSSVVNTYSWFFVSYFKFLTIFCEDFFCLLLFVIMFFYTSLLTRPLATFAVAARPIQKTFEVEVTVWVDLAEAAHHDILRDPVTSVLVTRAALRLRPAQSPLGRVAVTAVNLVSYNICQNTLPVMFTLKVMIWRRLFLPHHYCITPTISGLTRVACSHQLITKSDNILLAVLTSAVAWLVLAFWQPRALHSLVTLPPGVAAVASVTEAVVRVIPVTNHDMFIMVKMSPTHSHSPPMTHISEHGTRS